MVHASQENYLMQSSEYSSSSGHKVVASSLTSRVHELHSPRDTPPGQRRIRSHSAGRTTTRDIVQDVYDRMGVSRESLIQQESPHTGRGRDPTRRSDPPSADIFQRRYRAAAELSTARGRSRERGSALLETDGQRRARSLSRGRTVRGAWPPTSGEATVSDEAPLKPITTEQLNVNPSPSPQQTKSEYAEFSRSDSGRSATKDSPDPTVIRRSHSALTKDPIDYRELMTRSPSQSPSKESSWRKRASEISITTNAAKSTDEGEGDHDPMTSEKTPKEAGNTTPSIKDRISAYSGGKRSSRNFPQRYAATGTYAKRDHPPKIDIYGNRRSGTDERDMVERKREEDDRDDMPGLAPEPSTVPPSPAARKAASVAAELMVRRNSNPSGSSNRSTSNSSTRNAANGSQALGSCKVKSSARQTTSAPVSEIESTEQIENNSTTSSMSTDDFVRSSTPPGSFPVNRIPSWSERTKGQGSYKQQKPSGTNATYSQEDVDRIVEARVRSQVADLEARMETRMERLEQRLEKRMNSKLNAMDDKMNEMTAMLKMLVASTNAKQLEI